MLLGRDSELLALDRVLADARAGRSGVLRIVGEPGIGKTVLLDHVAERAEGMRVLRARGIESEAGIPFAGLAELLRPALPALAAVPEVQARALEGALALGPATARDRFAIGAATLSLLSAHAEEAPLVLLVDDDHLLDGASAEALLFAARRMIADPIAVVLAAREGEPSLLDGAALRTIHLAGLTRSDAARLLERLGVAGDAVERLYRASGGNPLALLELAPESARLAAGTGGEAVPISISIGTAFLGRVRRLPEVTRRMLLLASADSGVTMAVLARAARHAGLDVADLGPAEEAGLVAAEQGRLEFRHPLLRSSVYAGAPAADRRAAHAALAAALVDGDPDRRAWHLASATIGPDDEASAALHDAGDRARARSAYAAASAAFERGAQLASAPGPGGGLAFLAAECASLAGDTSRALALLDAAPPTPSADAAAAARAEHLRGELTIRRGPVMDGYPLVVSAAERIAGVDPEQAVIMLAQAMHAAFMAGDMPAMLAATRRCSELAAGGSQRSAFFAATTQAMSLVLDGAGEAGAAQARRAVEILDESPELCDDPRLLAWVSLGPMFLREADAGRDLVARAFTQAREQAAVGVLPFLLHHLARDQATTDHWPAAAASYDEAIRLGAESGQRTDMAASLAGLAWLEARQGREAGCREHAVAAGRVCAELGVRFYGVWAVAALGDLELGLGRTAEAVIHHEAQAEALQTLGIGDVDLSPAPELVEAYLRLDRRADAEAVATPFVVAAEAKGQPWALARALRCRALLAPVEQQDARFAEALREHARTPDAFETARTALLRGACLRRARRRVLAREHLRTAVDEFDRLGARTWADQARAELAASGETARRRDASTLDDLTPQELQIARLLADGMTTREAAAAVFLSPKTVEYHLRHVYAKLGINSRDALARALAG